MIFCISAFLGFTLSTLAAPTHLLPRKNADFPLDIHDSPSSSSPRSPRGSPPLSPHHQPIVAPGSLQSPLQHQIIPRPTAAPGAPRPRTRTLHRSDPFPPNFQAGANAVRRPPPLIVPPQNHPFDVDAHDVPPPIQRGTHREGRLLPTNLNDRFDAVAHDSPPPISRGGAPHGPGIPLPLFHGFAFPHASPNTRNPVVAPPGGALQAGPRNPTPFADVVDHMDSDSEEIVDGVRPEDRVPLAQGLQRSRGEWQSAHQSQAFDNAVRTIAHTLEHMHPPR